MSVRQLGCVVLFVLPFLLAAMVEIGCAASFYHTTRALALTPTTMQGDDGPRLLRGSIVVSEPVRSPAGSESAVWQATASRREGKRNPTLCTLQAVADLALVVDGQPHPLTGFVGGARLVSFGSVRPEGPVIELLDDDRRSTPSQPPAAAFGEPCARELAGVDPAALNYAESVLPVATPVTVHGCLRAGELVPCGDSWDVLTPRSPRGVRDLLSVFPDGVHHGVVWTSLVLAFLGVGLLVLATPGARRGA